MNYMAITEKRLSVPRRGIKCALLVVVDGRAQSFSIYGMQSKTKNVYCNGRVLRHLG